MLKRVVNLVTLSVFAALVLLATGCGGGGDDETGVLPPPGTQPNIKSVSPAAVPASAIGQGQQITITGSRFGSSTGTVELRGEQIVSANIASWSSNEIVIQLPPNTPQGVLNIVVTRSDGNSTAVGPNSQLQVGDVDLDAPVLISIDPNFGRAGDVVSLVGQNFGPTPDGNQVTFAGETTGDRIAAQVFMQNGEPAWSNTEIRVRVPNGARTGEVRVQIGTETSNPRFFQVQTGQQPGGVSIDSVSRVQTNEQGEPVIDDNGNPVLTGDASGFPRNPDVQGAPSQGSLVSIEGSGFGQQKGNSVVRFNGEFGRVVATNYFSSSDPQGSNPALDDGWSNSQILVYIPADAITGPIQVVRGANDTLSDSFRVIRLPRITGIQPFALRFGTSFELFGRNFGPNKGSLIFISEGQGEVSTEISGEQISSWTDSHIVLDSLPVFQRAQTQDGNTSNVGRVKVVTEGGLESAPRDFQIGEALFTITADVSPTEGIANSPNQEDGTEFSFKVNVENDQDNAPYDIILFTSADAPRGFGDPCADDFQGSIPDGVQVACDQAYDPASPEATFSGVTYDLDDERRVTVQAEAQVTNDIGQQGAQSFDPITIVDFDVSLVSRVEVLIENEADIQDLSVPGNSIAQRETSQSRIADSFTINQRGANIFNAQQNLQKAYPLGSDPPAGYASGLIPGAQQLTDFDPSVLTGSTSGKSLTRSAADDNRLTRGTVPPAVFTDTSNNHLNGLTGVGYPIFAYDYGCETSIPCQGPGNDQRVQQAQSDLQGAFGGFQQTADNAYGGLRIDSNATFTFQRIPPQNADNPLENGDQVLYEYVTEEPGLVMNYDPSGDLIDSSVQPWQAPNVVNTTAGNVGNRIRQLLSTSQFRNSGATVGRPMIHPGDRIRIYGNNLGSSGSGPSGRIVFRVDQNPERTDNLSDIGAVVIQQDGTILLPPNGNEANVSATIHAWGETTDVGDQTLQYIELTLPKVDADPSFVSPTFFENPAFLNGIVRVDKDASGTAGFSQTVAQFAPRITQVEEMVGQGFNPITDPTTQLDYSQQTIQLNVFDLLPPGYPGQNVAAPDLIASEFSSGQEGLANVGPNAAIGIDDGFGYFQWYEITSQDLQGRANSGARQVQLSWGGGNDVLPERSPIFGANSGLCNRLTASIDGQTQQIARPGDGDDWIANDAQDSSTQPPKYRFTIWSGHADGFSSEGARIVPSSGGQVNSGIIGAPAELPVGSRNGTNPTCP